MDSIKKILKQVSSLFAIFFIQGIISDEIGSSKLQVVFNDEIKNPNNHLFLKLILVLTYMDLKLSGYVDILKIIVKQVINNDFFRKILLTELKTHYVLSYISNSDRNALENMIADLTIVDIGVTKKNKGNIINQIKKTGKMNESFE